MKKSFGKVISVFMLVIMLFSTGVAGVNSSASSEADYVATFSIVTDKTSLSAGEDVVVSVNLKTNYYIYAMELPVFYDGDAFEVQNTSPSSNKSFLTFKGQLASAYVTNGNWKSPTNFYTHRNSNTEYWSQQEVMDRYKIAFASWAADTQLNDGNAVKLENEETIVSFVLKAKKDIKNISGLIFLSDDFKKTSEFAGGRWFCGRSKTEKIDVNSYVVVGQTLEYISADSEYDITVTLKDSDGKVLKEKNVSGKSEKYTFDGLDNGEYTVVVSKESYVSRVYLVSVTDGKATVGLKLNKQGDLNGDGKVNTIDVALANAHAKGIKALSDYELTCADITGDSKVNTIDVARINAHAKGIVTLW